MGNPLVVTEIDVCLSTLLLRRLEASDMSQRELSRQSGVKLTRLGDVLRRGRGMTTGELERIAGALGCVPWQVLKEAEDLVVAERGGRAGLRVVNGGTDQDEAATPGIPLMGAAARGAADRPEHAATHRRDDVGEEPQKVQLHNDRGV